MLPKLCILLYAMFINSIVYTYNAVYLLHLFHHIHIHTAYREELLVPGGLVLGLTTSIASRDLHEVCTYDMSRV